MPGTEDGGEINLKALRVSERQYRRLFGAAKDGILILNSITGQIEDVNPFLVGLLGYSVRSSWAASSGNSGLSRM